MKKGTLLFLWILLLSIPFSLSYSEHAIEQCIFPSTSLPPSSQPSLQPSIPPPVHQPSLPAAKSITQSQVMAYAPQVIVQVVAGTLKMWMYDEANKEGDLTTYRPILNVRSDGNGIFSFIHNGVRYYVDLRDISSDCRRAEPLEQQSESEDVNCEELSLEECAENPSCEVEAKEKSSGGGCVRQIEKIVKKCVEKITQELALCGNNNIDENEECDDGNNISGDGCNLACKKEGNVCGNGRIEGVEECDDGNKENNDMCSRECKVTKVCKDFIKRFLYDPVFKENVIHLSDLIWEVFGKSTLGKGAIEFKNEVYLAESDSIRLTKSTITVISATDFTGLFNVDSQVIEAFAEEISQKWFKMGIIDKNGALEIKGSMILAASRNKKNSKESKFTLIVGRSSIIIANGRGKENDGIIPIQRNRDKLFDISSDSVTKNKKIIIRVEIKNKINGNEEIRIKYENESLNKFFDEKLQQIKLFFEEIVKCVKKIQP